MASKKPETPEAKQRTFDFTTFTTSIPVPEKVPVQRATGLPFKDMYTAMEEGALAGKQPSQFIPTAFWVQRAESEVKGNAEKAATPGYAKSKLRGQFNEWVKAEETKRKGLTLTMIERKGTETEYFKDLGREPEAGISLWLLKT